MMKQSHRNSFVEPSISIVLSFMHFHSMKKKKKHFFLPLFDFYYKVRCGLCSYVEKIILKNLYLFFMCVPLLLLFKCFHDHVW